MVRSDMLICPDCGNQLKYFDSVQRIVRTKRGIMKQIKLRRLQCSRCGRIHREIPKNLYPYKQYESEVIKGVMEGFITSDTLGYEDYPCEMTMIRWRTQNLHFLLWKERVLILALSFFYLLPPRLFLQKAFSILE